MSRQLDLYSFERKVGRVAFGIAFHATRATVMVWHDVKHPRAALVRIARKADHR